MKHELTKDEIANQAYMDYAFGDLPSKKYNDLSDAVSQLESKEQLQDIKSNSDCSVHSQLSKQQVNQFLKAITKPKISRRVSDSSSDSRDQEKLQVYFHQ